MTQNRQLTQYEYSRNQVITAEMKCAAKAEPLEPAELCSNMAAGNTVILKSRTHECRPVAIGKDLKIKINANIGTSDFSKSPEKEFEKLRAAIKYGADTVMDLSTGGDIGSIRKSVLQLSSVPVGTVPIYEAVARQPDVPKVTERDFIDCIKRHIADGVDFITVHCGITARCIPLLNTRLLGVVSRGGSFLIKWMLYHKRENPLYTHYDEIVSMAGENDVTISLGDGLRPGCLADATDKAQIEELKTLGELTARAQSAGVQVIVEGPGHVPLNEIRENIRLQKEYCNNAPFYVLGPLVTDCSPGYDHISGAIGGALAAFYGADYLCYLTPCEHLGLPDISDVIDGVIASRIAAHAADIARGIPGSRDQDDAISRARSDLNWDDVYSFSFNPEKAAAIRSSSVAEHQDSCTMCGELCSAKVNKECRDQYKTGQGEAERTTGYTGQAEAENTTRSLGAE